MYAICLTVNMIPHLCLFYAKANKRFTDAINSYSQNKLAVYSCAKKN